jgi:hypothetical protein
MILATCAKCGQTRAAHGNTDKAHLKCLNCDTLLFPEMWCPYCHNYVVKNKKGGGKHLKRCAKATDAERAFRKAKGYWPTENRPVE